MNGLTKTKLFFDDGSNKREKENFQGFFFNSIDMRNREAAISFYRSDFRGAQFHEMYFSGNNFSNSDFIDCSTINSTFDQCQFKFTELYNSYFEKSSLIRSKFSSASFIKLVFEQCDLSDSMFDVNTFRECKFTGCQFINSKFQRNSIDDVTFEDTVFKNVDLSNMTAINLFFDHCTFENVVIDADYLGSYFFKGTFLDQLKLKYRGKVFDLDLSQSELLGNLFKIFFEQGRYYEAINLVIQKNQLEKKNTPVFPLIKQVIDQLVQEEQTLKRTYQFDKLFRLLEYYLNTGYVGITDYFNVLGHLDTLQLEHLDFLERINVKEKINRLKLILEQINLTPPFIATIIPDQQLLAEIIIDEIDQEKFELYFDQVMQEIEKKLSADASLYRIIDKRKGSLIYDILMYSGAALVFLKILKSVIKVARDTLHESIHLGIDYRVGTKVLAISKKIKGGNSLSQIKDIKEYQIMSKKALASDKDFAADGAAKLLPLIKSAIIYPNALPQGKD